MRGAKRLAVYLNDEQDALALDLDDWRQKADIVASGCGLAHDVAWSLTFVDDEAIQALNREYRQIDRPTDVLSFAQEEGDDDFPAVPGAPRELGDIIIAVPTALRQAAERGHTPEAEIALLMIHGLLHLLGEDHDTPVRKAVMWARQQTLLESLGLEVQDFGDAL
jgi:probable rRNA maturation factor